MKTNIYAVYDDKAEIYNAPFPLPTDGLAKRSFQEACKDSRTDLYKYPGDFTLYCLASWDSSSGEFENYIPPRFIERNLHKYIEDEIKDINDEIQEKVNKLVEETNEKQAKREKEMMEVE